MLAANSTTTDPETYNWCKKIIANYQNVFFKYFEYPCNSLTKMFILKLPPPLTSSTESFELNPVRNPDLSKEVKHYH